MRVCARRYVRDGDAPTSAAERTDARSLTAPGLESLLEGLRVVRRTPILLGAILLDLPAVLFGGARGAAPGFRQVDPAYGADRTGVITMLIAAGWSRIFPVLADVDRLDQVAPPSAGPAQAGALGVSARHSF